MAAKCVHCPIRSLKNTASPGTYSRIRPARLTSTRQHSLRIRPVQWRVAATGKGFGAAPEPKEKTEAPAEKASAAAPEAKEDVMAFEPKRRRPKVNAPVVDMVKGQAPAPDDAQFETSIVAVLLFLFSLLMGMGVFISVSGFLSDDLDAFAEATVYPAFTPVLGVFLLVSSIYGAYKAKKGEM